MRQRLTRLKALLDHDLSPAPIFAVFLGYWLPLEWMLSGGYLTGTTILEKIYAIASSAVFNFGFSAFFLSALVYLVAGALSLCGEKFKLRAKQGIEFVTWFVLLAVTILIAKRLIFKDMSILPEIRWIVISIAFILSISFMHTDLNPSRFLIAPKTAITFLIPISFLFVGVEILTSNAPVSIPGNTPASNRPDVLFITLDALSAQHLNMYGSLRPTSPNLKVFSNDAITLSHFYANANWTRPGIASLLNGARPWTHGGDLGSPSISLTSAQGIVKSLSNGGYDTRYVGTNWFAAPSTQHDIRWFKHGELLSPITSKFYGFLCHRIPWLSQGLLIGPIGRIYNTWLKSVKYQDKIQGPIDDIEEMINISSNGYPVFSWLHLYTAHSPYASPPPFIGSFDGSPFARDVNSSEPKPGFAACTDPRFPNIYEGRYDEAIRCMDDGLGKFFAWLKATGRYDRTLIVVTADHGESFSHGYAVHGGPLLTEDLIWIPCLIKPPYHHGAERDDRLYEQADLAPTILQMVGLPVPPGMEGYPISQKPEGLPVFAMNHDRQPGTRTFSVAVRLGDWKYVEHWGHWTAPWPQRELYDLASDPGENQNLVATRPDKAAELRGRILAELARRQIDPEKE